MEFENFAPPFPEKDLRYELSSSFDEADEGSHAGQCSEVSVNEIL
jgi:hypothetical protein